MSSTHPFVFVAMGTMVSLTSVQPLDRATQDTVISAFVDLEERFSLYRDDTEASRFARGELDSAFDFGILVPAFVILCGHLRTVITLLQTMMTRNALPFLIRRGPRRRSDLQSETVEAAL